MRNISIVLVSPSSQGNIGAVARSMKNFGFTKLILVTPECEISTEAKNRAKHAQDILRKAQVKESFAEVIEEHNISIATTSITGNDYNIPRSPLLLEEAAKKIVGSKTKTAIFIGPEDQGLSNTQIRQCDYALTIPASGNYKALNMSHAATIIMYELSKHKNSKLIKSEHPHATIREKQEILKQIMKIIDNTKFSTPHEKQTQVLAWKKIIGKSHPTKREAYALIGFLKKQARKK